MPESIRIERLCKVYRARDGTEVEALREVSFTVGRGALDTLTRQKMGLELYQQWKIDRERVQDPSRTGRHD